ncbi:TonB-dependent receptor [Sphingobium sp. AM]|uniref:TonB-dependent receptor n=1 Tax=Sphingobium sp. AM TaxID=1176302 RepID=UPI000784361B|nr:TonB-dependent receptor [Sphingobium sp. AM]KXU30502.1 TonB-dependent receptor [Sphingobium sp. AM]
MYKSCGGIWLAGVAAVAMSGGFHAAAMAGEGMAPATVPAAPGGPGGAAEQDAALRDTDIIVTAQKRAQNLSDVPMSITAVTGEQLQSRGIASVQDLVKLAPGFNYVESGIGVPVYSLRGIGFFDTSIGARPTVSVYIDEAPLPFSVMSQGAAFDIERVEILKGPQGTLFGQNSTGGAINYIAAKPKDVFGAGITASYARFNTVDAQGYITGPVAPGLDFRIAARGVRSGGWQKSYTRDDTLGEQRFAQGRFMLDWHGVDRLKVSLNLSGFIDRSDTQAGQFKAPLPQIPSVASRIPLLLAYPVAPENARAADWDPGQAYRRDNRFYQIALRTDYELTDQVTLTMLNDWSHMRVDQDVDIDGTALKMTDQNVYGRISSFSTEVRATGRFGPATVILGASYARDKTHEEGYFDSPYSTENAAFTPTTNDAATWSFGKQSFRTYAVFGNVDLDIGDKVTLHGGARYTKADLSYDTCLRAGNDNSGIALTKVFNSARASQGLPPLAPILGGECTMLQADLSVGPSIGSFDQDNVSWKAGADFKPAPNTLLYFNVSRGYKAGSIPVTSSISYITFLPVRQESVLAYELGFKASLFDRLLDATGALFNYDYTDKQLKGRSIITPNIFGPLEALTNIPKSRIRGAEAQLILYPLRGLTLSASGTYLDTRVIGDFMNYTILANLRNFEGNPFPYTPKYQYNLDASYKFPATGDLDMTLAANFAHRSRTSAGFGNEAPLRIDAYGTLDLRAGIGSRDGRWTAEVFGKNVTNSYYWTNVAKLFDVVRRLSGQPATYGVRFSHKF